MQTLKVQIPDGFEIDSFDKSSGEIKIKPKPAKITDRIKTVEDVLNYHGITASQFEQQCQGLSHDEVNYRIIKLLAVALNEGWVPDWTNPNQYKYFPWFEMAGSSGFRFDDCVSWGSGSDVGSRLCFKSRELAEHAGKHFTDQYRKFMSI